ncbi:hypothetical protein hamaS1_07750 [Moorella sp. Hama-1]|nr:hypothetical protein hamaS1_07750 [Moorella sp. Hama-1]
MEPLPPLLVIAERLGYSGEWGKYLEALRKEYARLPALQDEFNKAGL